MKKLLSLPPNLVQKGTRSVTVFHDITGLSANEFFCTCDPEGHRVGSGGGTAWLLWQMKGDAEAARMFKGQDCLLQMREGWTLEKNSLFDQL